MIAAILPPFRLIEITAQSSYPLNSEKARPPGTLTEYLSWAEIETLIARTPSAAEIPALIRMLLLIVAPPHAVFSLGTVASFRAAG